MQYINMLCDRGRDRDGDWLEIPVGEHLQQMMR